MRHLFLPIISLLFFGIASAASASDEAFPFIQQMQKQYAPDKREAVFDISAKRDGNRLILSGETSVPAAHEALVEAAKREGDVEVIDQITVLPEASLGEKNWALVNLSVANIRAEPDYRAEMVTQATLGTPVRVLKKKGHWYLIQTPNRYLGWVESYGIARKTAKEMQAWRNAPRTVYLGDMGVVRALSESTEKGNSSNKSQLPPVVSDIVLGSIVEVCGKPHDDMTPVALPDGRKGYVPTWLLLGFDAWCEKFSPTPESLTSLAKLFLGRPYLWGGTSAKGMDCSGLINVVYLNRGIILPRDASQIRLYGKSVTLEEAKPGDLLFWGYKNGDKERTTHIGLYLGDKKILHSSGRVREGHIDSTREGCYTYAPGCLLDIRNVTDHIGTPGITRVKEHPWYQDKKN